MSRKQADAMIEQIAARKSEQLNEKQARRSEIELMIGRLGGLSLGNGLTSDQRIGTLMALKVLESRRTELELRRISLEAKAGDPS